VVEVEGTLLAAFPSDQLTGMFDRAQQLRVRLIAPQSDGNPRRGCEDPNCPAVRIYSHFLSFIVILLVYNEHFRRSAAKNASRPR
jgi:hypothetical protein